MWYPSGSSHVHRTIVHVLECIDVLPEWSLSHECVGTQGWVKLAVIITECTHLCLLDHHSFSFRDQANLQDKFCFRNTG